MKNLFVYLSLLFCGGTIFSQQLFQTTQFMVSPYTLNPALAGSEDFLDIKAGYRNQWLGFEESDNHIGGPIAPRTSYLSAHMALGHDHGYYKDPHGEHKNFHGVGGFVVSDKLGATSSTSVYGSYSLNMKIIEPNKNHGARYGFNGREKHIGVRMIVGTHLGLVQQQVDFTKLVDNTTGSLNTDPLIVGRGVESKMAPDASFGVWVYSNYFYTGLAVRRAFGNSVKLDHSSYSLQRHYNLMGGYKFFLSEKLLIEPSAIIKVEGSPKLSSLDLNTLITYDNTYTNKRGAGASRKKDMHVYTGLTYRPGAALSFLVGGVFVKKYEIAYSFDLTTNQLNPYEKGTHEITVGYRILPGSFFETAEGHYHR